MHNYISDVYNEVEKRNPNEREFLQAVKEVLFSLQPVLEKNQSYRKNGILERIVEPDRVISFRVPWIADDGQVKVNRGYRVQFNNAIGPYKGGLRFHPMVNQSIVKFLGFEQIFKNSLTGLPIGGAKGGSDFDPKNKSEGEVMRFCQSFMSELHRHIGSDVDVPAGDLGVGHREIGYLFGQYKKIQSSFNAGVLTGKGINYGGSLIRKEATGYGLIYFLSEMMAEKGIAIPGKKAIVSGSGNVAIYAMEKLVELGAKTIACSDSQGYIIDEEGIDVKLIKAIKEDKKQSLKEYLLHRPSAEYKPDSKNLWDIPCDLALPCAVQNEIDVEQANKIISGGCIALAEGANMPTTIEAVNLLHDADVLFGPAKAANAGGVAVSALEMTQNSMRYNWTRNDVDHRLMDIMKNIYSSSKDAAEHYGLKGNLLMGANIAGFEKVAKSIEMHGIV